MTTKISGDSPPSTNDYTHLRCADPRALDTEGVVRELWQSWTERSRARFVLERVLPHVLRKAESQMDEIVAHCAGPAAAPHATAEGLQRAA